MNYACQVDVTAPPTPPSREVETGEQGGSGVCLNVVLEYEFARLLLTPYSEAPAHACFIGPLGPAGWGGHPLEDPTFSKLTAQHFSLPLKRHLRKGNNLLVKLKTLIKTMTCYANSSKPTNTSKVVPSEICTSFFSPPCVQRRQAHWIIVSFLEREFSP